MALAYVYEFMLGIKRHWAIGLGGLIAVIMSTADSFLHAAGLSLTHDVIRPLRTTQFPELRWMKYCAFVIRCISILMTLMAQSIFGMVVYGLSIMGATITVPFVAGVLGSQARSSFL